MSHIDRVISHSTAQDSISRRGTSHISMSHVTHTNESCHTYKWVMTNIHTNESWHIYEWVMSHIEWVMSRSTARVSISSRGTSRMQMSHVTHTNESWHIYEWVMSHNDCVMSRSTAQHSISRRGTAHISMSHVTNTNESCHTYKWVMTHIWMSHVTQWLCHVT